MEEFSTTGNQAVCYTPDVLSVAATNCFQFAAGLTTLKPINWYISFFVSNLQLGCNITLKS